MVIQESVYFYENLTLYMCVCIHIYIYITTKIVLSAVTAFSEWNSFWYSAPNRDLAWNFLQRMENLIQPNTKKGYINHYHKYADLSLVWGEMFIVENYRFTLWDCDCNVMHNIKQVNCLLCDSITKSFYIFTPLYISMWVCKNLTIRSHTCI